MTESNRLTDFVARLREAFDGDNVPAKNIALRKAADAIEKLMVALKPFSDDAQYHENRNDIFTIDHDDRITVGDIRAARAAYLGEKE